MLRFRKTLICITVLCTILSGFMFSDTYAKRIYVSPSGNNANSGLTRDDPKETISAAINMADPGDEIRLLPGIYYGKTSITTFAGEAENPLVIMSDSPASESYAIIDGGVELVDGVTTSGSVANDLSNHGFELRNCSWITFKNLKFQNCWAHTIVIRSSQYIKVTGCDIRCGKRSIYPRNASHHVLVENTYWELDPRVWDTWDWASLHHGVGGSPAGIAELEHFNGGLLHPKESYGSLIMRGCVLKNCFNGFRTKPSKWQEDGNVEIYNNVFINVRDNAFEPEYFAWNIHFYHNTIYNSHKSFSIDDCEGGPIYVYGNIQSQELNPEMGLHYVGGYPDGITGIWKFKGPDVLSEPCYAFNNSFYTHATAFKSGEATNRHMKHFNNAYEFFTSESRSGEIGLTDWHDSFEFDNDAINLTWPDNIVDHDQEEHGVLTNELFVDGLGEDLRLKPGSPCVDAGKVMEFPEFDWIQSYEGSAPDIGAFEGDKLVEGPPFRYMEPPNGGDPYDEKPRIVRHKTDGNQLILYFSEEIGASTVNVESIHLYQDGKMVTVEDVSFPDHNWQMVIQTDQDLEEDGLSLLMDPLPMGVNGEYATHWASTIPLPLERIIGDINEDGVVDIMDVVLVVNIILGYFEPTVDQFDVADFDGNGSVNVIDVVNIVLSILGNE